MSTTNDKPPIVARVEVYYAGHSRSYEVEFKYPISTFAHGSAYDGLLLRAWVANEIQDSDNKIRRGEITKLWFAIPYHLFDAPGGRTFYEHSKSDLDDFFGRRKFSCDSSTNHVTHMVCLRYERTQAAVQEAETYDEWFGRFGLPVSAKDTKSVPPKIVVPKKRSLLLASFGKLGRRKLDL